MLSFQSLTHTLGSLMPQRILESQMCKSNGSMKNESLCLSRISKNTTGFKLVVWLENKYTQLHFPFFRKSRPLHFLLTCAPHSIGCYGPLKICINIASHTRVACPTVATTPYVYQVVKPMSIVPHFLSPTWCYHQHVIVLNALVVTTQKTVCGDNSSTHWFRGFLLKQEGLVARWSVTAKILWLGVKPKSWSVGQLHQFYPQSPLDGLACVRQNRILQYNIITLK